MFNVAAHDAAQNTSPQSAPLQVTTSSQAPPPDTIAPSTPTNVTASSVTSSQATLSWQSSSDNFGVTGYRVYRNGSVAGTATSTTFTATGLAASTTYSFALAAYDAAGNSSPQSAPLQVTTSSQAPPPDTIAPSTPTNVTASSVTTSQATLSWQASSDNVGVTGYRVYRNGSVAGTATSTTFTATGLGASTTYSFTVAAYDAAGNSSPQSAPRSVTTPAATTPSGGSPLASYDFDAGAGTVLADRSGNNYTGTLVNGPVWTTGMYGGGLAFDGVNDYVTMGDVEQADALTSITVSTWVKFAVAGSGANEIHLVDKSLCAGYYGGGPGSSASP